MIDSLRLYARPKMLAVLILGFSSGLPLALTGGTLQAWLSDSKFDVKIIGALALIGIPYNWKFLWSPLMDRYVPPFLGRRRGWILVCQLLLAAAVAFEACSTPNGTPLMFGFLALLIAFLSASQDIVIDAYRTDLLSAGERGPGAGLGILGYRVAMLTSGALALILADHFSWSTIYLLMSGLLAVLSVYTFMAPEPAETVERPRTLEDAVVKPFVNFFTRPNSWDVPVFVILYKLGDVMAVSLTTKFMLDLGFSKSDIGYVAKGLGLACSIGGSLLGGTAVMAWGLRKSLLIFGVLQGVSVLCFGALSLAGKNYLVMSTAIGLENFCNGLGNAALVAFLMGLCDRRFTATQYSLLTGIQSFARTGFAATSGYLVAWCGWTEFFIICAGLAIPGLAILIFRYEAWEQGAFPPALEEVPPLHTPETGLEARCDS